MNIFSSNQGIEKLKKVLINDKHQSPTRVNEILKSDVFAVLQNYMDISENDIISKIDLDQNGNYIFRCKAKATRLKTFGILP